MIESKIIHKVNAAEQKVKPDAAGQLCYKVLMLLKVANFHSKLYFHREIAGFERRTDYLWIAENGDLVFQGEFCHLNDCYLIATKVHNIRPYYKEIKALIKDYCQKGIGHSISSDCEDGTPYRRKIKGSIRVEINLETLTEKEIIRLYENTLKNKKFPDENKKRSIKKELDLYDERMSESHL